MKSQNLSTSSRQAGFTLIELLVVIAILGVLATIALASLNSARIKGADSAVKGGLKNALAQAAIFYDTANTYTGACDPGTVIDTTIFPNIQSNSADTGIPPVCSISTAIPVGQKIAITAVLRSGATWCVDDSGVSKAGTSVAGSGVCS